VINVIKAQIILRVRRGRRPRRPATARNYIVGLIQKILWYFLGLIQSDNLIGLGTSRAPSPTSSLWYLISSFKISRSFISTYQATMPLNRSKTVYNYSYFLFLRLTEKCQYLIWTRSAERGVNEHDRFTLVKRSTHSKMSKRSFAILKRSSETWRSRIKSRLRLELCHLLKKVDQNFPLPLFLI